MIRRPPRSTLFPTRRSSDLVSGEHVELARRFREAVAEAWGKPLTMNVSMPIAAVLLDLGYGLRSEEHTSELQSHSDLVCRLLLEKKKTKIISLTVTSDW